MDKQTCKFLARLAENLPEMPPEEMQAWIEKPRELKFFLSRLASEDEDKKLKREKKILANQLRHGRAVYEKIERWFVELGCEASGLRLHRDETDAGGRWYSIYVHDINRGCPVIEVNYSFLSADLDPYLGHIQYGDGAEVLFQVREDEPGHDLGHLVYARLRSWRG